VLIHFDFKKMYIQVTNTLALVGPRFYALATIGDDAAATLASSGKQSQIFEQSGTAKFTATRPSLEERKSRFSKGNKSKSMPVVAPESTSQRSMPVVAPNDPAPEPPFRFAPTRVRGASLEAANGGGPTRVRGASVENGSNGGAQTRLRGASVENGSGGLTRLRGASVEASRARAPTVQATNIPNPTPAVVLMEAPVDVELVPVSATAVVVDVAVAGYGAGHKILLPCVVFFTLFFLFWFSFSFSFLTWF
jgi:hypothetical protein